MIQSWIVDTLRAFGRQMGLENFVPNDNGAAGVRFENGLSLYVECSSDDLLVSVGVAADASETNMKKLLASAHPAARQGVRLRAIRVDRAGEARFVTRLAEREISLSALEQSFRALWQAADYFRRSIA